MLTNNGTGATLLALPWGVSEGDDCNVEGTEIHAPIYFDTLATGNVGYAGCGPAELKVGAAIIPLVEFKAEVKCLKLSLHIENKWCTATLGTNIWNGPGSGIQGIWRNNLPGFEELPPNLELQFVGAVFPIAGYGCPANGTLTADFFLETMSTTEVPALTNDTAFVG